MAKEYEEIDSNGKWSPRRTRLLMVLVAVITAIAIWLVPVDKDHTPSLPPAQPSAPDTSEALPQPSATIASEELALPPPPGGIGTVPELANEALLTFLRERCPQTSINMSVCSGSALFAKAGLLDGLRATSNKMFFNLATSQSDQVQWVEQARWVDAGQYVTSSGVSAGTDMALAVIERLFGAERAQQVATFTEYQWHTDADADPFVEFLNQADPAMLG